jgi:polysaccharide pyruvyl transferase WcaK-like protein
MNDMRLKRNKGDLPFPELAKSDEVVIAGNYGGGNLGDEAMLDVILERLPTSQTYKIIVPTRRKAEIRKLHNHPSLIPVGALRGIHRALVGDALLIGGGTIFSSLSGIGIRAIVAVAIFRKLLLRKGFYFYGIGYSKSTSRLLSILAGWAFNLADGIYVRDTVSYEYINKKIKHSRLQLMPELAFHLSESDKFPDEVEKIMGDEDTPIIGLSLMHLPQAELNAKVIASIREVIEYLHGSLKARFYFLTFQPRVIDYTRDWRSDGEIGELIIKQLPEQVRDRCHVLDYYSPRDTLTILSKMDLLISMRYHCLVFAYMQGKPYVAISFDDKHTSFVKDHGGSMLPLTELSKERMIALLEKIQLGPQ